MHRTVAARHAQAIAGHAFVGGATVATKCSLMFSNEEIHIPPATAPKRRPTSKTRDEVAHRANIELHVEWSNAINSVPAVPNTVRRIETRVLTENRGLMQMILNPFKRRGTPTDD